MPTTKTRKPTWTLSTSSIAQPPRVPLIAPRTQFSIYSNVWHQVWYCGRTSPSYPYWSALMSVSNNSPKRCPNPPSDHVVEISHGDIPSATQTHSPLTVILLKPITFRCTIQISQKMIQIHLYNLYTIFCKCAHNEHAALTYSAEVISIHDSLTTILLFKPQTDPDQGGIEKGWAPLKTKTKTWRKKNPGLGADPATNNT